MMAGVRWRMEARGVRDVLAPAGRELTLEEFLLACVAEDKAAAREAAAADIQTVPHEHMVRWQPARVLAECEAKRRIVEEVVEAERVDAEAYEAVTVLASAALRVLRIMAQPYADRPGFREEWRL